MVTSESSSSSEETFRKACRFLNITPEDEWFQRSRGRSKGVTFSFCEPCTKEVQSIQALYNSVQRFQSMIFRKVELFEKRITEAEIVDNWMSDDAQSTLSIRKLDGFRKEVLTSESTK